MLRPETVRLIDAASDLDLEIRAAYVRDYNYGSNLILWANNDERLSVSVKPVAVTHEHLVASLTKLAWDGLVDLGLVREEDTSSHDAIERAVRLLVD